MPLGRRFVTVDYLAKEGRVEPNPFLLKEEACHAYDVQNKLEQDAENNIAVPLKNIKNTEIAGSRKTNHTTMIHKKRIVSFPILMPSLSFTATCNIFMTI